MIVGVPEIFVGAECKKLNLQEMHGLIKAKILPPQNLFHPVLPFKQNDKLMFTLCGECSRFYNKQVCRHTAEERCLTGTWTIPEVNLALTKGYEIMEIYEIWSYKSLQHSETTEGLFRGMMDAFIKLKQEASDFPKHCKTHEDKLRYISEYAEREGIKLDYDKIMKNEGLRSLSKLMLNSFWCVTLCNTHNTIFIFILLVGASLDSEKIWRKRL